MGDASPEASRGIRDYDEYLEVIDEIEKIEQIITPPKYRRCCYKGEFLENALLSAKSSTMIRIENSFFVVVLLLIFCYFMLSFYHLV